MARRRRRRVKWLPAALAIVIGVAAAWLILVNFVFLVTRVEVRGEHSMADADVIRLAQLPVGRPLREVDREKVQRSLESSGTLALVDVTTRLPNTVVLTVRERKEEALVQSAGSVLAMDSEGYAVAQYSTMPEGTAITVTGLSVQYFTLGTKVGADPQALENMCAILQGLKELGAESLISEMNVANSQDLYLYTRTGIQVMLGDGSDMEQKLRWMKSAIEDLERRGETEGKLDVSSGNKADFRPRGK